MKALHKQTAASVDQYVSRPTHAVAIIGEHGSGVKFVTDYMKELLNKNKIRPVIHEVYPQPLSIGIDQVQQLRAFVKHKNGERLTFVILHQAETMTIEAQNGLLKQLEEPVAGVHYVLTVENGQLLPTILSRCTLLRVLPLEKKEAETLSHSSRSEVNYLISAGRAELYLALENVEEHELTALLAIAKQIVTGSLYQRMIILDKAAKDKTPPRSLLNALLLTCRAALVKTNGADVWQKNCHAVLQSLRLLDANVGTKLTFDYLAASLA